MRHEGYLERTSRRADRLILKYGGNTWRGFFHFAFWNLSQPFHFHFPFRPINDDVCRIVFLSDVGGMGDILLALNYIQNFDRHFNAVRREISIKPVRARDVGVLSTLARNQQFIHRVLGANDSIRKADLVIGFLRFPRILFSHRKKIARLSGELLEYCEKVDRFQKKNGLLYRYSTPADAFGIEFTRFMGRNRLQQGDVEDILGVESLFSPIPSISEPELLAKYSLKDRPFMTVSRGSGGRNRNISMKLWSKEGYSKVLRKLREQFPSLAIVQVGMGSNSLLEGVTIDLRGKTNLDEIMILLRKSAVHLDGEGGLVHLRHFLKGGPSVVLFGPTSPEFYGYPENVNLSSGLCPKGCEWMTIDYEKQCPRGFSGCRNSAMIDPETVVEHLTEILHERL